MKEQYLENTCHNKGKTSGSNHKENQYDSKEGKNKWKGQNNKIVAMTHPYKDLKNHYNHCNINGHT